MRIAILDLGTNTFNIFIAEIFPDKTFARIYKSKIAVKLGEGGINKNFIEEKPFRRGLNALRKHKNTIEKFGVEKKFAFATSAIRSASNGNDFVKSAKEKTGIDVQIISGEREAELIYYGVRLAVEMNNTPSLIIDIGGGSTEFIIATKNEILWKHSFLLGAARLLDKFKPSNPITEAQVALIENHFAENLQPLLAAFNSSNLVNAGGCTELIGSSGSFDSLAEMIGHRFYNMEILKGKTEYEFNLEDFHKLYQIILASTTKDRLHMKGLTKMRIDMIVVSAIFVNFILKHLNLKKMRGSRYSLKEGVLWEVINS
jgi:exopolyphosphatase / guanosine-5'-triphosphate,3'-diphosphate pyrophosphatase